MADVLNGFTGFNARKQSAPLRREHNPQERKDFDLAILEKIGAQDRRWAWTNIDISAIRFNTMQVKRRLPSGCRLMAVVKADAYGHGAVQVAKAALNSGAEYLGVATVDEAIELRQADIRTPIMILAEPPYTAIPLLLHYAIEPAVYTPEFAIAYAELADAHGMRAPYHLAINSGMNRIGVRYDEVMGFLMAVNFHRSLDLVGTFTHFATADAPESYDFHLQVRRFIEALTTMNQAHIDSGIVHCDNTAALMRYPETNFNMVRLGLGLYGYHPCPETARLLELKPAMSVHARITDVKTPPVSDGVSYGLTYRSPGSVKICTLPIGYADGYQRILSGRAPVLLDGRRYPQVGRICMDQCMFEVNLRVGGTQKRPNPQIGNEVVLLGAQGNDFIGADELADIAGTIPYEILTGLSRRLPRFYS